MSFRTVYEWQHGCLNEIQFEDLRPGMIAIMEEPDGSKMTPFFLVTGMPFPRPQDPIPGNAGVESVTISI